MERDELTRAIIGAAIEVHRALGPGLLESTHELCLCRELNEQDLLVQRQVQLPIRYKGLRIDAGYRIDLLVNNEVIVELKCIDKILPVHEAQLLTYLKLAKKKRGLLLNFNVPVMRQGIKRMLNG